MILKRTGLFAATALAAWSACAPPSRPSVVDAFATDDGKGDAAKSTKLVDDLSPDSVVDGDFDRKTRVYGYLVEAKRGAKLTAALSATAGADANGPQPGAALDTFLGVYGPFESIKKPGPAIVESDDDGDQRAAPPVQFEAQEDARYLVLFSSWEDPGKGHYRLSVSCEGTDLQCRRPDWQKPCAAGTIYIQGGQINADTIWDQCEVVLLEPTTLATGKTLTIKPGVTVKGNFLGGDAFGNVTLNAAGTLQASGTAEHPIAFTSLKRERGWGGLVLSGKGSSLDNVVIERANVAVSIPQGGGATLTNVLLEGVTLGQRSASGVLAAADVDATFTRALVKGFTVGLNLANAHQLVVEDSIIRENQTGVVINGTGGQPACWQAAPPTTWRDPRFVHTDIVANFGAAVNINGADILVQIESSNIIKNGGGIVIQGGGLHPESYLRRNNIYGNGGGGGAQVTSYHVAGNGVLDLSENYWSFISDPELSASFATPCNGPRTFRGFSPVPIADAGPRPQNLCDSVKQESWAQKQAQ